MKIEDIIVYPVKSLRGISLPSAQLKRRGLQYDRRWMLIKPNGQFISQRDYPILSRIQVAIIEDQLHFDYLDDTGYSLQINAYPIEKGPLLRTEVWGNEAKALPISQAANKWFSQLIESECQLVYMPDSSKRLVNQKYAGEDDIVSFADGYPILAIGTSSLEDLNKRLETAIEMERFRPNLVVSGEEAFGEDRWNHFKINQLNFRGIKPCARCIMTTVDSDKGVKAGAEPVKTLASYRKVNNNVYFGMNLIWSHQLDKEIEAPVIKVGDSIEIISRHESIVY